MNSFPPVDQHGVPVRVKPNPRRAAFLNEEATIAALAGKNDVAEYLKRRAFGWMTGQRET